MLLTEKAIEHENRIKECLEGIDFELVVKYGVGVLEKYKEDFNKRNTKQINGELVPSVFLTALTIELRNLASKHSYFLSFERNDVKGYLAGHFKRYILDKLSKATGVGLMTIVNEFSQADDLANEVAELVVVALVEGNIISDSPRMESVDAGLEGLQEGVGEVRSAIDKLFE